MQACWATLHRFVPVCKLWKPFSWHWWQYRWRQFQCRKRRRAGRGLGIVIGMQDAGHLKLCFPANITVWVNNSLLFIVFVTTKRMIKNTERWNVNTPEYRYSSCLMDIYMCQVFQLSIQSSLLRITSSLTCIWVHIHWILLLSVRPTNYCWQTNLCIIYFFLSNLCIPVTCSALKIFLQTTNCS